MYIDAKTTEPCPTSWPVLCTNTDPSHVHQYVPQLEVINGRKTMTQHVLVNGEWTEQKVAVR